MYYWLNTTGMTHLKIVTAGSTHSTLLLKTSFRYLNYLKYITKSFKKTFIFLIRNNPDISMCLTRETGGFHNSVIEDSFCSSIGTDQGLEWRVTLSLHDFSPNVSKKHRSLKLYRPKHYVTKHHSGTHHKTCITICNSDLIH